MMLESICVKNTIRFCSRMWKFIFLYCTHDDAIKHQTAGHNAYRIIIIYFLLFHWINSMIIFQGDIFWWRQELIAKWWKCLRLILPPWMNTTFRLRKPCINGCTLGLKPIQKILLFFHWHKFTNNMRRFEWTTIIVLGTKIGVI